MAQHFTSHRARVDAREIFFQTAFEQTPVRDFAKIFRDEPNVFFGGHPMEAIESGQVYRLRISPERPFAPEVEVDIKVAQGQLAQGAVNRLAVTAPGEVRLGYRPPMPARLENRDDMVGVLIRFEIQNERWKSEDA
jgi:hypothetical protein